MSFCGFAGSEGPNIDNNEPIPSFHISSLN